MKKLVSYVILTLLFTQCANQQSTVQKKLPFEITEKTYQYLVGGRKETGNAVHLHIKGDLKQFGVQFVSVFFHNKETPVNTLINDKSFIIDFTLHEPVKQDRISSGIPLDEYGNPLPKDPNDQIPFKLGKDEAVIHYNIKGKEYYYKVSGIKELKSVYYE